MGEEIQEKKQQPEKPKKAGGELDVKKLLMVIVPIFLIFIVAVYFIVKMIVPQPPEEGEKDAKKEKVVKEEEEEIEGDPLMKYAEIEAFNIITKNLQYYIQIQLGFKVKIILKEGEEPPEEGGGHGAAAAEFAFSKELVSESKSKLNVFLGSMTMDDINKVSRDSLRTMIKNELKPLFKKNKYILKEVMLVNFTPAPAT